MGITTVDDAGLMKYEIDIIDSLQKVNELKMRVYAMLSDSGPNYKYYLKKGPYKTERLNVCSFKFYADGALGSRGACLLNNYADKTNWKGFLLNTEKHFNTSADLVYENGFQMNTHCIGDSAMRLILYAYALNPKIGFDANGDLTNEIMKKRRWRIEHSQIINEKDLELVKSLFVIPSIQPTHATSDMYWAEERLGKERIKFAYAYKQLLNAAGLVAIGTDFPVEDISPFKTFYAAVYRKDSKGFPKNGFQMENALTREETIKGMTIWAAYSNFEEKEKGSLTAGKFADFVILDTDLIKCQEDKILNTKVLSTFIAGEEVYKK
jgi:predicted amidohydrolase YtcJ